MAREERAFIDGHPRSARLYERARRSLLGGVPMNCRALNRGVLLTPFHNMALVAQQATEADIDRHTELFAEMSRELAGSAPGLR